MNEDVWTVKEVMEKVDWEGGWWSFYRWAGPRMVETDNSTFNSYLTELGSHFSAAESVVDELVTIGES